MSRRSNALGLVWFVGLSACSQGAVLEVTNSTQCDFRELSGYKISGQSGQRDLVFRLEKVEAREVRAAYFELDWTGLLEVVSELPPFYSARVDVRRGSTPYMLELSDAAPSQCQVTDD